MARVRQRLKDVPRGLVALTAVGAMLRLHEIGEESLWNDEFASMEDALALGPDVLLEQLGYARPLYYLLLRPWIEVVGTTETGMRLLSAILGIAAIPAIYYLGVELYDGRSAFFAALFLTFSRFHVRWSQDVRMYALAALLATVSYLGLVRYTREGGRRNRALYIVATVLMGYTHIYAYFVIVAQNIYVFAASCVSSWRRPTGGVRRWVTDQGFVALALSPVIVLIGNRLYGMATGSSGSSVVSWIVAPSVWAPFTVTAHHLYQVFDPWIVLFTLVLLAIAVGYRMLVDADDRDWDVLLGSWFVLAVFVPVFVSHIVTPILVTRYTIVAAPALYLIVGESVGEIIEEIDAVFVRRMLVIGLVVVLLLPLANYYQHPQREQWDESAALVESRAEPGDVVFVSRDYTRRNFMYYYEGGLPVVGLPDRANSSELRAASEGYDRAWLVLSNMDAGGRSRFLDEMNATATPDGPRSSWSKRTDVGSRALVKSFHRVGVYRFDVSESVTASAGNRSEQ
jgi:uncharacterized membrane protein